MAEDAELVARAESGDLNSQRALALLYEIGIQFEADQEKALHWWIKAAENGDKLAQFSVSEILRQDEFRQNPEKLEKWQKRCSKFSLGQYSSSEIKQLKNRVLIIDDARFQRDLLAQVCEMKGFEAVHAESGEEALKKAAEFPDIQLVFLDLVMPKMNGVQFLKLIRKMQLLEGVPVVVISQSVSRNVALQLKELKINSFLAKPVTPHQIDVFLNAVKTS
ncbi:MAG: response regulator [Deltaproteobacteria bacterium]|nr:response regulator [Deltaproteobacteria bacterium]